MITTIPTDFLISPHLVGIVGIDCVWEGVMSSDELIKLLKKKGWTNVRSNGSHWVFAKDDEVFPIVVPHPRKDLATGTLNKILKQIGEK